MASSAIALLFSLWFAGFFWFIAESPDGVSDKAGPTDAIIVLTGGSERLRKGMELLGEGKARKLFVSGVHPGVTLGELMRTLGSAPSWTRCCVVLGYEARNTRGNAAETAQWMKKEGYRSLRLVTSWYHMPRSLLDFERAMPTITIVPHPVFPPDIDRRRWWRSGRETLLLFGEYSKYLFAFGEPPAFQPDLEAPLTPAREEHARRAARIEVNR